MLFDQRTSNEPALGGLSSRICSHPADAAGRALLVDALEHRAGAGHPHIVAHGQVEVVLQSGDQVHRRHYLGTGEVARLLDQRAAYHYRGQARFLRISEGQAAGQEKGYSREYVALLHRIASLVVEDWLATRVFWCSPAWLKP